MMWNRIHGNLRSTFCEENTPSSPSATGNNNKNDDNDDQMYALQVEKERGNEKKYLDLYTNLIRKNYSQLLLPKNDTDNDNENYREERVLLKQVLEMEKRDIMGGIGIGLVAALSFRYGPSLLIRSMGKSHRLQQKEQQHNNSMWKSGLNLLLEASFGIWVGQLGYQQLHNYNYANTNQKNFQQDMASIPLCAGRSQVSDILCDDWLHLTNHTIPSAFWDNIRKDDDKEQLNPSIYQQSTFQAIRTFAQNCQRRKLYEKQLSSSNQQKQHPIVVPKPGVPTSIDVMETHTK